MFGLIRSLLFAGAKSIIAALWKLNDLSAYFTMVKFYHNLSVRKMNKSQSLRDAQLYVRDLTIPAIQQDIQDILEDQKETNIIIERLSKNGSKPFGQFYYWSPYILIGDWI
jgi:CHAT domain-containing protein